KMVSDAEEHAGEDRARKEEIATRNNADAQIYSTEKMLKDKELADKFDPEDKKNLEEKVENLRKKLEHGSADDIKSALDELTQAQHRMSEKLYQKAGGTSGGDGAGPSQTVEPDEVVDAEFEVGGDKG
ncbi:Hsp70 family protein, partial [Candidatus Sumerlaeota bacterium]|nr:Hsp70 family protein [Candidatus Sumerlaeota bacterium]